MNSYKAALELARTEYGVLKERRDRLEREKQDAAKELGQLQRTIYALCELLGEKPPELDGATN